MKYYVLIGIMVFVCCCKDKHAETTDDTEWKEMEEFHTVMADVYHPLKDSNNLEPIKHEVGSLSEAATKWAQAPLPKKVDNDSTKELLTKLEDGTKKLATAVKNGDSDEVIASKLTMLHDIFHSIMESWYEAGKEEHHH